MGWRQDLQLEIDQLKNVQATKMNTLNTNKEDKANKKQDLTSVSGDHFPSVPAVNDGLNTLEIAVNSYTDTQLANYVPLTEVGAANGVAELDANGTVPAAQLPSFVDEIIEGELINPTTFETSPGNAVAGASGKIYVDTSDGKTYRWSGTLFAEISSSLALGETSTTAYRGDRGKIAYDHSQLTSGNPHNVTKAEVGLGNVDNTSDANKPVSTAQAAAIAVVQAGLDTYKNAGGVPDWSAQFLAALNF